MAVLKEEKKHKMNHNNRKKKVLMNYQIVLKHFMKDQMPKVLVIHLKVMMMLENQMMMKEKMNHYLLKEKLDIDYLNS